MFNQLPVKNIVKLNWLISLTFAMLFFIFLVAFNRGLVEAALRSVEVFGLLSVIAFTNLFLQFLFTKGNNRSVLCSRFGFYSASYLLAICAWILIRSLYAWIMGEMWEGENDPILATFLAILSVSVVNTFVVIMQSLIVLQYKKNKSEMENLQLKANESEITNLLLRQQIHPHFLFNSLNTIKSLYRSNPEQGQEYLVHLANFLRTSLSNQHEKKTPIKHEIAFCLDYLEMQSIRFGTALDYSINISESKVNNKYLPYFCLQPLIENILKHNDFTEKSPVLIKIEEKDGYVVVSNNLQPKKFKETSTGSGLRNLNERYLLLGSEKIKITSEYGMYNVRIKILEK